MPMRTTRTSSRWSDHCASPCKAPISKPARRGSVVTSPQQENGAVLDEDHPTAPLDMDSMIYYIAENRWTVDDNEHTGEKLRLPMRRQSLAKDAQPEGSVPISDCETLERQTPWASTA